MRKLTNVSLLLCIILFAIVSTLTACTSSNLENNPTPDSTKPLIEATEKSSEDTLQNTDVEFSTESNSKEDDSIDSNNSSANDRNNESSTDAPIHIHSFGDWKTVKTSSCTEKGELQRSCACGEIEIFQLDMLSHTEVTDSAVKPTCTADGLTEGSHCSVCQTILITQTKIAAKGHDFSVHDGKRCAKDGCKLFHSCSYCEFTLLLPLEERYFINQISASQRENLIAVYHALLQCPTGYINLPNTLSNPSENIDELSDLLYYSCPELVQLSTNEMSMSYTKKQVQFNVTMSLSEYENYCIELFDILYELNENTRDMTDWEKSKYVYDFIIQSTTYEAAASDSVNAHEGSALGPLIVGRARCQGYANAYQLCMWAVGIECYAVTGVAGPDNGRHAWNIANIDGNYYLSDVTWDDIDQASSGYAYFNVSTAEFPQHTADAFWINLDRKSTRLNSSHPTTSRMPSYA